MAVTIEEIADAMYEVVKEYTGRKSYTARELSKEMKQKFGPEADRKACKDAIKVLLADRRCVYTYKGSSYEARGVPRLYRRQERGTEHGALVRKQIGQMHLSLSHAILIGEVESWR